MANTIITKFQNEGLADLATDLDKASDKMDLFAKAHSIVSTASDGLSKKQLELREQINSTGGILQKMNETNRQSGTLYDGLQKQLTGLVAEYTALESKTKENTKKQVDYNTVLKQVADGQISARTGMKQLREEMVRMAAQGRTNEDTYKKLRKSAGELADTISDVSQEAKAAGSDTRGIDNLVRSVNLGVNAVTGLQGAFSLFGGENKNVQQTLVYLNGAMLLSSSIQEIGTEITRKDSVVTQAAGLIKRAYAGYVGEATGATLLFKQALLGLGIGAVIALVLLAIKAFSDWNEQITTAARQSKLLSDSRKEASESIKSEVAGIYELVAIAKNENATRADREEAIKRLQQQYPEYLKNISLETIGTEATNEAIREQIRLLTVREQIKKLVEQRAALENQKLLSNTELFKESGSLFQKILIGLYGEENLPKTFQKYTSDIKAGIQKQIDDIDKAVVTLITQTGKSGNNVLEIKSLGTKEQQADVKKSIEKFNQRNLELYLKSLNDQNKAYRKFLEERAKLNAENIQKLKEQAATQAGEQNRAEQARLDEMLRLNQLNAAKLAEIKANENREKQQNDNDYIAAKAKREADGFAITQSVGNAVLSISKMVSDSKMAYLDAELNSGVISQKKYQQEVRKIKRNEAIAAKAEAAFNIGLSIAQSIVKALTTGPIVGQVLAGITAALGFAQLAFVLSKPIPQFRNTGLIKNHGLLQGKSHEQGGVKMLVEAEGKEYFMPTGPTEKHYAELEAMRNGNYDDYIQRNKFMYLQKMQIPMNKVLNPDLPAVINISGYQKRNQHIEQSEKALNLQFGKVAEEISYLGAYIKSGNADRVRGTKVLVKAIDKLIVNGY